MFWGNLNRRVKGVIIWNTSSRVLTSAWGSLRRKILTDGPWQLTVTLIQIYCLKFKLTINIFKFSRDWKWFGSKLIQPLPAVIIWFHKIYLLTLKEEIWKSDSCLQLAWFLKSIYPRGRPRNSWRRGVESQMRNWGHTWATLGRFAQDRTRWRTEVVNGLCSNRS